MTAVEGRRLPEPPAGLARSVMVGAEVREYLRHLIMTGHLREGDRLRVEHLAALIGISVTPVREALMELLGEGFVVRRPRRGYVVAALTRKGFEDRVLVLAMVAGELAARACSRATPELLDELLRLQSEIEECDSAGRRDDAEVANHRWHRAVNLAADSPELAWTADRFSRYYPRYTGQEPNSRPRTCTYAHHGVIDALRSGTAEAARAAMFDHLVDSSRVLGDDLARIGLWRVDEGVPRRVGLDPDPDAWSPSDVKSVPRRVDQQNL